MIQTLKGSKNSIRQESHYNKSIVDTINTVQCLDKYNHKQGLAHDPTQGVSEMRGRSWSPDTGLHTCADLRLICRREGGVLLIHCGFHDSAPHLTASGRYLQVLRLAGGK